MLYENQLGTVARPLNTHKISELSFPINQSWLSAIDHRVRKTPVINKDNKNIRPIWEKFRDKPASLSYYYMRVRLENSL